MTFRKPSEDPRAAARALSDLADALERAGVTAWLTDGTLLGAVRDGGFIPHDLDMDLAAMSTQYGPDVEGAIAAAGFETRKVHGTPGHGLQHKLARDGFRVDIFWHYDTPDGGVKHSAYDRAGEIEYLYPQLVLARYRAFGREFWAPTPPKLHLVTKYGPDWRTPQTEWDWADGPANARRSA